jgi:hypothetical protein
MNFSKFLIPIGVVLFVAGAWHQYQWQGVAVAIGAVVMWILLHFTRMVTVLSRAANRPVGHVGSAVMMNAKLKKGVNLMHVIAMTKSLGERMSEEKVQPEVFKWADTGDSFVTCTFKDGMLIDWTLTRPDPAESDAPETTL